MTAKPNANKWSDIQLAIAAISMTTVIAFWNMFAAPDKAKADEKAAAEQQNRLVATVEPTLTPEPLPTTPAPTMPPTGYTILFGGVAPQPQVIVVNKPASGQKNKNNNNNNSSASQPATTTSSS